MKEWILVNKNKKIKLDGPYECPVCGDYMMMGTTPNRFSAIIRSCPRCAEPSIMNKDKEETTQETIKKIKRRRGEDYGQNEMGSPFYL